MKHTKRFLAAALSVLLAFCCAATAFAADADAGKPYNPMVRVLDSAFGAVQDGVFGAVQFATQQWNIPTYEKYLAAEHPQTYAGTTGAVRGSGWSAGFASGSVIPESWRCDASGAGDPNGWCLKAKKATGGYQTKVTKLYTDQMLNMLILSNGSDAGGNGVKDVLLFASVDGVGLTAGTVLDMRKAIEQALRPLGVTAEDILSCNISATHCHAGLDTEGMNIPTLFLNKMNPLTDYDRSLDQEMEKSLCKRAAACAKDAYAAMESGRLSFFETSPVNGAEDKLNSGVKTKNYFSCFLFEGISGKKTILSNIGAHPTSYGAWNNKQLLCTDYPYFMAMALREAGYNLVFVQSAQAAVSPPSIDCAEGDAKDAAAAAWAEQNALTREEWIARFGEDYTAKWYEDQDESLKWHMKRGYLLAHHILDAVGGRKTVAPIVRVKNAQTLLPLDNGVIALGSISGLLGETVVRTRKAESGFGVMVETNYIELGSDVAIFTAPGELSAGLLLGSDPNYTGKAKWTGKTSWTGEDWKYDTIVNLVRKASGDSDKTVLLFGITNDALGYIYPDICTPKSLLGTALFYKEDENRNMTNCMLMTVGTKGGSAIMEGYIRVLAEVFG